MKRAVSKGQPGKAKVTKKGAVKTTVKTKFKSTKETNASSMPTSQGSFGRRTDLHTV